MEKTQQVYRRILAFLMEGEKQFTQLDLSKQLKMSISTVNHALKPIEKIGGIRKRRKGFTIRDEEKILLYFATTRNLEKDVVYRTNTEKSIRETEKNMPADTLYTAYTAYKYKYEDVPADYSEVIVYADPEEIKKRFPKKKGHENLIVLKKDENLESQDNIVSTPLLYADLWNLNTWYAREFLKALKKRIEQ